MLRIDVPPGPRGPDLVEGAPPERRRRPRNAREKLDAGLKGLKLAVRGDSSFFAHAYRGVFIVLAAALLGVGPLAWCLLVIGFALVLVAELFQSAIEALGEGLPESPKVQEAAAIAAGAGLVATMTTTALATAVLVIKLGDLFGWWS